MHLMRLGNPGTEIPVVRTDGRFYDLRSLTDDIDGPFLAGGGIDRAENLLARGDLPIIADADSMRIGPPIARPGAVLCIGQNYAAHAAESGNPPPETPVLFFKHPNTIVGPHDMVLIPPGARKVDWEVELAVVIGTRAAYLDSIDTALAHVAGYTISNDVSERDYQMQQSGGQWSKGKCCPTFNPLGPALVPARQIPDPQRLRLTSAINGQLRQDSNTSDMVFSVAHLVWHLSHYLTLEPGDIINTGTPAGVGLSGKFPYLDAGDRMALSIDRLGSQDTAVENYARAQTV
ncbi:MULTISPECIES: fumarylacetoacetate hydrolase family protein [Rhodococcus]|jgi:2,4-diketo-3-deoxy-L-fuconate hydrolase|uniref:Fumarylacetoacetate hydrolase family protein n=1 Tax=Rhodococcus baikonurensis TaxID=172041 RepID=A0ABV5XQX0_9NOCA